MLRSTFQNDIRLVDRRILRFSNSEIFGREEGHKRRERALKNGDFYTYVGTFLNPKGEERKFLNPD